MANLFSKKLLEWNKISNNRMMPWKGEKDPYKIWLSEIILQQTRVEQGTPYYEKFIYQYPNIKTLAKAKDQDVFKLWEGLGYYNRCKNLLSTARYIASELDGIFPTTYDNILALKGIGPYTAAAISSFAYNLPYAVLDGNVFRVLARYFGIDAATDSTEGKKIFAQLAQKKMDTNDPGTYNQALMDFGATVCTPFSPACLDCLLHTSCLAFQHGAVNLLPIKEKSLKRKTRHLTWFILIYGDQFYIRQRQQKDIWENLYDFYLIESESSPQWNSNKVKSTIENQIGPIKKIVSISSEYKQQLTHQQIKAHFIIVQLTTKPKTLSGLWIDKKDISTFAYPKLIKEFITQFF